MLMNPLASNFHFTGENNEALKTAGLGPALCSPGHFWLLFSDLLYICLSNQGEDVANSSDFEVREIWT